MRPLATTVRLFTAGIVTMLASAMAPAPSFAQPSDKAEYRASIYGFFPHIGGTTVLPGGASGDIDIDADTLLEHTDVAVMGMFEVQKGRWGAFADIMYFDIGAGRTVTALGAMPLPPGVNADLSLDIKATVLTMAASYRAVATPRLTMDVFGGARLLDAEATIGYAFNVDLGPFSGPMRQGEVTASDHSWDAIGGVKGRIAFGRDGQWFIPYYADIGAGESDLTVQGLAGLGYAFRHVEIVGAWRYLSYDMKPERRIRDLEFNGPGVGVTFKW